MIFCSILYHQGPKEIPTFFILRNIPPEWFYATILLNRYSIDHQTVYKTGFFCYFNSSHDDTRKITREFRTAIKNVASKITALIKQPGKEILISNSYKEIIFTTSRKQ